MKNQNKILMSLLTASVSALATAPVLANSLDENNQGNLSNTEGSKSTYINFDSVANTENLNAEENAIKQDIKAQVEAMLNKKAPIMKISESIDIVVDSYGKNNDSIKKQVFQDLNLAATYNPNTPNTSVNDSALSAGSVGTYTSATTQVNGGVSRCHAICHSACHGACHGSRGWR